MAEDIAAVVAQADLPAIASTFTTVKPKGNEFICRCVFHAPDDSPSLYLYHKNGKWNYKCFACGEAGDSLDWIEKLEGLDTAAALKRINGGSNWQRRIEPERREPLPNRVTAKPPPGTPAPKMALRDLGEPARIWPYKDSDGSILGYIARYETPEGKQIRCWSWGSRGGDSARWGCGHWAKPRPLYGLDRLAARPEAPVLVVEGEKACDAASALLPLYVVIAWPGGSNAWHKADWAPVRERKILLWPDNDAPGIECMEKLAAVLSDPKGYACSVRILDPGGVADGFDAADWTGTTEELIAWAKPRARDYQAKTDAPQGGGGAESLPLPAAPPPAAPVGDDEPPPDDDALPISMSEDALANAFAGEICGDWRYVSQWGEWMHWDGDGWVRDRKERIDRLAVELCRRACTWKDAQQLTPAQRRAIGQRKMAGAIRDLTRNDRRIAEVPEIWDADPLLVGIPGGVFDIKAGKTVLGQRDQFITKQTAVAPAAGTPRRWLEHLKRMMDGDEAMIRFLQTYAGYCATGDTREQCFLFLYGMGQTGKGTFLLTLHDLLGSYAAMSAASTFMQATQEKHSSEIARLSGCRLIVIDETDGTARWNEERLKRMTGGGKITAARKYRDEEDISVTWKLAFAGNHKPALRGVGKEMERRIRLVKCNASIPDDVVDRNFRASMIAEEGPQILAWILEGATSWLDGGLPLPEPIADATRDYLSSEDVIGDWLAECCESKGECERPNAYRNYSSWAERRGDRAWSNRAWWSAMEDRGFTARKTSGLWWIKDLSLQLSAPDSGPPFEGYDVP